jgi:hypothetical protein
MANWSSLVVKGAFMLQVESADAWRCREERGSEMGERGGAGKKLSFKGIDYEDIIRLPVSLFYNAV